MVDGNKTFNLQLKIVVSIRWFVRFLSFVDVFINSFTFHYYFCCFFLSCDASRQHVNRTCYSILFENRCTQLISCKLLFPLQYRHSDEEERELGVRIIVKRNSKICIFSNFLSMHINSEKHITADLLRKKSCKKSVKSHAELLCY